MALDCQYLPIKFVSANFVELLDAPDCWTESVAREPRNEGMINQQALCHHKKRSLQHEPGGMGALVKDLVSVTIVRA